MDRMDHRMDHHLRGRLQAGRQAFGSGMLVGKILLGSSEVSEGPSSGGGPQKGLIGNSWFNKKI